MKKSTLSLTVLLVASLAYAAFLQTEVNRLQTERVGVSESAALPLVSVPDAGVEEPEAVPQSEGGEDFDRMWAGVASSNDASNSEEERAARRLERFNQMLAPFDDPQMRVDMIERQMDRIDMRYADFFKTLDLGPDELDTLRTLMAERRVIDAELRMRAYGADSKEGRDALGEERKFQRELLDEQVNELMGEKNAMALNEYNGTLPYRGEVESLASSLSFTDSPLKEKQVNVLVNSIRDVSESFEYSVNLSKMGGRQVAEASSQDIDTYFAERVFHDDQILSKVAKSLDDSQLAAYAERQLAERERDRRQIEFLRQNPDLARQRGPRGPGGGPR